MLFELHILFNFLFDNDTVIMSFIGKYDIIISSKFSFILFNFIFCNINL